MMYHRALESVFDSKDVLVLHDVNIDLLHLIDEESLRKALSTYQRSYPDSGRMHEMVEKTIELASTSGGEIIIDDLR